MYSPKGKSTFCIDDGLDELQVLLLRAALLAAVRERSAFLARDRVHLQLGQVYLALRLDIAWGGEGASMPSNMPAIRQVDPIGETRRRQSPRQRLTPCHNAGATADVARRARTRVIAEERLWETRARQFMRRDRAGSAAAQRDLGGDVACACARRRRQEDEAARGARARSEYSLDYVVTLRNQFMQLAATCHPSARANAEGFIRRAHSGSDIVETGPTLTGRLKDYRKTRNAPSDLMKAKKHSTGQRSARDGHCAFAGKSA